MRLDVVRTVFRKEMREMRATGAASVMSGSRCCSSPLGAIIATLVQKRKE